MKSIILIVTIILVITQITGVFAINEFKKNPNYKIPKEFININYNSQNHQWPMYKHDAQHTGRSDYDTSNNPGHERWKYFVSSLLTSTPVIEMSGILYVASDVKELHSVFPDGTRNWKQGLIGFDGYDPAIGLDGTIYVGSNKRFHAFYPNGTLRWILDKEKIFSGYPVISPDDIIYVGTSDGYLYAIYPNSTIKWEYKVNDKIRAPALDSDGNIYFTTFYNCNLYCLNSNGTLKWKFKSLNNFYNGPVIGNDGTIYLSPSSINVQAVNPNGTEKWRTKLENGGAAIPAIAPDGSIIISGKGEYVNALDSDNGNILWTYYGGIDVYEQTSAVIGADGTIYFAYIELQNTRKGYICALSPEGKFKWKTRLSTDIYPYSGMHILSDLSIGSDGTVYVTSWFDRGGSNYTNIGYLHAIGELAPDAPSSPIIEGPTKGSKEQEYEYKFKATSPIGNDLYYFIDWDDISVENCIGPYPSGVEISVNHTYNYTGKYSITSRAKDTDNLWGPWSEHKITIPKTKKSNENLFLRFLEKHPQLFPILKQLLEL